jgi:hypothetical protein
LEIILSGGSGGSISSVSTAVPVPVGASGQLGGRPYDKSSVDSQFTDVDEELTVLDACIDCDDEGLYELIQDGVTWEQVNERDKSGRTGLSHACASGFIPILELLGDVEDVDPNLADNDGNTPLIFAAQAGHDDVVNFLLRHFRHVRIDQCNKLGFTALMKAAIQGRTRCAKLLLFAGADPSRRDFGRGLCAEEWARFCGCHNSADAIAKYIRSTKYFLKKTFLHLSKDKWTSEPDLVAGKSSGGGDYGGSSKSRGGGGGSWLQRHLSLKRKKPPGARGLQAAGNKSSLDEGLVSSSQRSGSAPLLITISPVNSPPSTPVKTFRRPSCVDGVVPVGIVASAGARHSRQNGAGGTGGGGAGRGGPGFKAVIYEEPPPPPPQILATDFDLELETSKYVIG